MGIKEKISRVALILAVLSTGWLVYVSSTSKSDEIRDETIEYVSENWSSLVEDEEPKEVLSVYSAKGKTMKADVVTAKGAEVTYVLKGDKNIDALNEKRNKDEWRMNIPLISMAISILLGTIMMISHNEDMIRKAKERDSNER